MLATYMHGRPYNLPFYVRVYLYVHYHKPTTLISYSLWIDLKSAKLHIDLNLVYSFTVGFSLD